MLEFLVTSYVGVVNSVGVCRLSKELLNKIRLKLLFTHFAYLILRQKALDSEFQPVFFFLVEVMKL